MAGKSTYIRQVALITLLAHLVVYSTSFTFVEDADRIFESRRQR